MVVMVAVEKNGSVLEYAPDAFKGDMEVLETALKQLASDGESFIGVLEKGCPTVKEMVKEMVKTEWVHPRMRYNGTRPGWESLLFVPDILKGDKDVLAAAFRHTQLEGRSVKEMFLEAIATNASIVNVAPKALLNDREVILAALKHHGGWLRVASEELKDDRELALVAMQSEYGAFRDLSNRLKEGTLLRIFGGDLSIYVPADLGRTHAFCPGTI